MSTVINEFLQRCANRVKTSACAASLPHVTAVVGNESGDMDSIVGSMYLSYYLNQNTKLNMQNAVPVIKFPRDDLELRNDVVHLFRQHAIDYSMLISSVLQDGANGPHLDLSQAAEIVLYDHNALPTEQEHLYKRVVGVVDHHVEDRNDQKLSKLKIHINKTVGSACTLVAQLYQATNVNVPLPELLTAPIILDTVNFSQEQRKVTEADIKMFQWLRSLIQNTDFDNDLLFNKLMQWKAAVLDLSVEQNLRRDYKQFVFTPITPATGAYIFGISSIPCKFSELNRRYGMQHLSDACEQFVRHHALHALLILCAGKTNDVFSRDVVCVASSPVLDLWNAYIKSTPDGVSYTCIDSSTSKGGLILLVYSLSDASLSRKQLVPSLTRFVRRTPSGL